VKKCASACGIVIRKESKDLRYPIMEYARLVNSDYICKINGIKPGEFVLPV